MSFIGRIPTAIQGYLTELADLPKEDRYVEGLRLFWEAITGLFFDDASFGEGKVPVVRGNNLTFEDVTGGAFGDMTKSVYDANDDGRVDAADHATTAANADDAAKLGGALPAAYDQSGEAAAAVGAHEGTYAHGNIPTAGEKAALPGTSGAPGAGNKYVTDADARNSDARTPAVHAGTHATGQPDAIAAGDIGAATAAHTHATLPTADEKAALAGTSGSPDAANKYVTDADARNSDARTPTAHAGTHATGQPDAMAPGDIGASAVGHHHDGGDIDTAVANATNAATAAAAPWAGITDKPSVLGGVLVFRLAAGQTISHDVGVPLAHGQFVLDAGGYASGAWTFRMVGWVSGPTAPLTARARFYNLTDGEYVTGADVTTTATSATLATSGALTVGAAAGNFQDTAKIYEGRLEIESGAQDIDTAHFGSVELVRS